MVNGITREPLSDNDQAWLQIVRIHQAEITRLELVLGAQQRPGANEPETERCCASQMEA